MNYPAPAAHRLSAPAVLACCAVLVVTAVLFPFAARAQVLVYDVKFEEFDRSINFSFFERGFFVVEALGGTGSFVLTFKEDGRDFYLIAADAGELFFAVKPGVERAVMRASAVVDSAQTQYLVIGDLDSSVSYNLRGQRVSARVASRLTGNVLASDSEPDVEFTSGARIGFAGFAEMLATLNQRRTQAAKRSDQTVDGAVEGLIEELERLGFENEAEREDEDNDDSDGDGGGGNGSGDGNGNGEENGDGNDDGDDSDDDSIDDGSDDGDEGVDIPVATPVVIP